MPTKTSQFNQICQDIRNFRPLTKEQKQILLTLSEKEKDEVLLLYNEIIKSYAEYLDDDK
jgi:hypothetical protein